MVAIDLIDKLIDRLIQLVNYRKENKRQFLDTYLAPLYEAFEEIHEAYLSAFKGYLDDIRRDDCDVKSLIETIEENRLFEDHRRRKVLAMSSIKPESDIDRFLGLIQAYLVNPYKFLDFEDGHRPNLPSSQQIQMQRWRGTLVEHLREIMKKKDRKEKAVHAIEMIVLQMQDIYGEASAEYVRMRREFD